MRRGLVIPVLVLSGAFILSAMGAAQEDGATHRKVVTKVSPEYPPLARRLHLVGVVKVEAVVSSDGKVKTVEIKGGHPILAQAAAGAVAKWKWESAAHETKEPVDVRFDSPQ